MQFSHTKLLGMQAWHAQQGNWSFLILKDNTGFLCTYRNFNNEKLAVAFKGTDEFHTDDISSLVPASYYFYNLKEAQIACKKKYKEILIR